jgi:hypothetical protein
VELPLFQQPVCRQAAWRWVQLLTHVFSRVASVNVVQVLRQICCSPLHFIGSATAVPHQSRNAPIIATNVQAARSVMRTKTI